MVTGAGVGWMKGMVAEVEAVAARYNSIGIRPITDHLRETDGHADAEMRVRVHRAATVLAY